MPTATKTIQFKDIRLLDLVMTGEAAQMAGCDRRTFIDFADSIGVKPFAVLKGGKILYRRDDAERIAKAYKSRQDKKRL